MFLLHQMMWIQHHNIRSRIRYHQVRWYTNEISYYIVFHTTSLLINGQLNLIYIRRGLKYSEISFTYIQCGKVQFLTIIRSTAFFILLTLFHLPSRKLSSLISVLSLKYVTKDNQVILTLLKKIGL